MTMVVGTLAVVLLCASIALLSRQKPDADEKLTVVASFYPMAEFAHQVGGDHVRVTTLVKPGIEPHDYEPSPRDVANLYKAKVLVYNGAGLEKWIGKLAPDLTGHGVTLVETSQGLQLQTAPAGDSRAATDPHIWLDPVLAIQQVKRIQTALSKADPTHSKAYAQNATRYIQELQALDTDFRTGLAHCERHDIVTSHRAFGYLAAQYNLQVVNIAGLSPDDEPSPQDLATVADFVREHDVHYIFFETLVSPKLAQTIAAETGVQTMVFNPLEGLTQQQIDRGMSYTAVQKDNLQALRTALHCQ